MSGFLVIVVIGLLWVIVFSIMEYRQEKNDKNVYIPRDYDRKIEEWKEMLYRSRCECHRPIILRRRRDNRWVCR